MSGKGDNRRPTDEKAYSDNYDRIFGKKDENIFNGIVIQTDAPDRKACLIDLGDGTFAVTSD